MRDGDGRSRNSSLYYCSSSWSRHIMSIALFWCVLIVVSQPQAVHGRKVESVRRRASEVDEVISTDVPCPEQMFQCNDGRCIPSLWTCDNDRDCAGGEDESDEQCKSTACTSDEFQCKDGTGATSGHLRFHNPLADRNARPKCIPKKWQCDGEFDCDDQSDESGCSERTCSPLQHECGVMPGQPSVKICIPLSWKCDHHADCADGSDEANCTAAFQNKTCRHEEFKCDNDICIFSQWKCDGDNDCGDGSDEKECDRSCGTSQFTCKSNKFCIPAKWRCDGEHDCIDGSDEQECKAEEIPSLTDKNERLHARNCKSHEFACRTGDHCINLAWKCDNDNDCPDGSDEDSQTCPDKEKTTCDPDTKFRCNDGACIDAVLRCNGLEECHDGSDEHNCTAHSTGPKKCNYGLYDCGGGICLEYAKVCDGKADCPNAVDENADKCSKDQGLCKAGSSNCSCRSASGKAGKVCTCARGFNATEATDECVDVNECLIPGRCSQKCENTPGSFKCSCHHDYVLQGDMHSCRARGADPKLLLSNRATIRQVDLITSEYMPLITQLDSAVAMDFLVRNNTLIWSDVSQEKIMICHMGNETMLQNVTQCQDGKNISLVSHDISTPDGLAVDWVHDLLFWTDTGLDKISVIHLPTRHRRTLFDKDLDEPRAIAVDPFAGLIFWTDWGDEARIERAGMDGSSRKAIVTGELIKWPNGLAVDILEQRIYWADAKMKMISSAGYWGNDQRMILQSWSTLKHPFSLSLFEEQLYWTDWDQEGVLTVNKFTGADLRSVVRGVSGPMTVRVYHEVTQPDLPNKCANHPCSDLCLPRPHIPEDMPEPVDNSKVRTQEQLRDALKSLVAPAYSCLCRDGYRSSSSDSNQCVQEGSSSGESRADSSNEKASNGKAENIAGQAQPKQQGTMAFTTFSILLILSLVSLLAGYVWYRRRSIPLRTLNFDNPVYRRTVEETDSDPDIFDPASGANGGLKLSLDAETYNPTGPAMNDAYVSESPRQPLTQAMV